MAQEVQALNVWLRATLLADATLAGLIGSRLFVGDLAPQGVTFPYLRMEVLSAIDVNAIPARRTHSIYIIYLAVVTLQVNTAQQAAIMDRVDTVLQAAGATSGSYRFDVLRESQVGPLQSNVEGVVYSEMGAQYRCWVRPV